MKNYRIWEISSNNRFSLNLLKITNQHNLSIVNNIYSYLLKVIHKPIINILIRTSNRPSYFESCFNSIINQTYKKIRIYVSYDDEDSLAYLNNYSNIIKHKVNFGRQPLHTEPDISRGRTVAPFPYNLYLNQLMDKVTEGFIIYLDDDDIFTRNTSVATIVKNIGSKNDLLFWRVLFPDDLLIPEDDYFGLPPVYCHISGIGFAFHNSYISSAQWDGWKGGDFAVATKLYNSIPNKIYINEALTRLQRESGWGGFGDRADKQ